MKCSDDFAQLETFLLETPRLKVSRLAIEDAPFMLELLNEPAFIRNIGDKKVRTIADTEKFIQKALTPGFEFLGSGMYKVELKDSAERLGLLTLIKRDTLSDVDIGYAFLERHWRNGYALEATTALLHHARDVYGLKRILGVTVPENIPSSRVLEKMGLKLEVKVKFAEDRPECNLYAIDFAP
ncbi:MAG: GNAT family N-acetyltransferase [Methylotenera sp.]|nr:GNAT family N-acetyltransferase [Oligoflexia bacterium]